MKRKTFFILIGLLLVLLTACSSGYSNLVGVWESEYMVLGFYADGTGTESREGELFEFSWSENEGILTFDFIGDTEGSFISGLMARVLHGSRVEAFGFSISDDGQVLSITDDHGHGHFNFVLSKTE